MNKRFVTDLKSRNFAFIVLGVILSIVDLAYIVVSIGVDKFISYGLTSAIGKDFGFGSTIRKELELLGVGLRRPILLDLLFIIIMAAFFYLAFKYAIFSILSQGRIIFRRNLNFLFVLILLSAHYLLFNVFTLVGRFVSIYSIFVFLLDILFIFVLVYSNKLGNLISVKHIKELFNNSKKSNDYDELKRSYVENPDMKEHEGQMHIQDIIEDKDNINNNL